MGADTVGPQLLAREPKAASKSAPIGAASGALLVEDLRQVLGADHVPDRVELAGAAVGLHLRRDGGGRTGEGVAATASDSSPGSASTAATDETEYQRSTPGSPVVSQYGGPGKASTSRPPWSSRAHGPSARGRMVDEVADRALDGLPAQRHEAGPCLGAQAARRCQAAGGKGCGGSERRPMRRSQSSRAVLAGTAGGELLDPDHRPHRGLDLAARSRSGSGRR